MFGFLRGWKASKVSAALLLGIFNLARFLGMSSLRMTHSNAGSMEMMEARSRRSLWKWIIIFGQFFALFYYTYNYILWIMLHNDKMNLLYHGKHILLAVPCYLWIMWMQHFNPFNIIRLCNRFMWLFGRVRSLSKRKRCGLGGGRELFLILLWLICLCHELVYLVAKFEIIPSLYFTYVLSAGHIAFRINFVWCLSLGVLYSEINEYVATEMRKLKLPQKDAKRTIRSLKRSLNLYREIYSVNIRFQAAFNGIFCLSLMHTFFYISVFSHDMIYYKAMTSSWLWIVFLRTVMDLLLLSLAIQGALNAFRAIRDLPFEMSCFGGSEDKDWQRAVEIFLCYLNQNQLKVSILGLFDMSMEMFLSIAAGLVTFLIMIIRSVFCIKNNQIHNI